MLGRGQTARHKGREHLLSHYHSRDRVQIGIKSFSHLYQTNTAPCNTTCSWKWVESRIWIVIAVIAGSRVRRTRGRRQQGEPGECPGVSSSHKAPQGHLLAEGNHDSQDPSTGTDLSSGARSTRLHFKYCSSISNTVERDISLFSLQEVDYCGVSSG